MTAIFAAKRAALAALLISATPALAQQELLNRALGLPPTDTRPPQSSFVLPDSHPDFGSQLPAARRASTNFYALPGLMDMPSAEAFPDGELQTHFASFGGISRFTLSFQIAPRLTGAFRYSQFKDINFAGFVDYYDRAFDLHYQLCRRPDHGRWTKGDNGGARDLSSFAVRL